MRKLLLLLTCFPTMLLGQLSGPTADSVTNGEGAAGLIWLGSPSNANLAIADVEVNDTIVFGIKLTNWLSDTHDITYAHIDVEYNKNAYTYLETTYFAPSDDNPQNSQFEMTGYKMSWNNNYEHYDIWNQWQNGSYTQNADWNNLHPQTQTTGGDLAELDYYVSLSFKVKDAGENHDYTDNIMITMGRIVANLTNGTSKVYNPVFAYEKQDFSYEPLEDIDVQGIIAKLNMGNNVNMTNFKLIPVKKDANGDWVNLISGNDYYLNVPSDGQVDLTSYITSTSEDYGVLWNYGEPGDPNGTNDFKTLYEDILTISDVQLALKELATHGSGAINAGISKFNADVAGGTNGASDDILDDSDTYKLLAHVMGVSELYTDVDGDGDVDDDDANNSGVYFFRSTDGSTYTTTTAESFEANGITHQGAVVEVDVDFSNVSSGQTFELYGTWKGDVNLSHSPSVSNGIVNDATSISFAPPAYSSRSTVNMFTGVGGAQIDLVEGTLIVEEQGDNVIATISIPESNLSAAQIRLNFDDTRLTFDSVQADSGNTTTNFAKLTENRVNFGSINTMGEAMSDTTYTVTFSKKTEINGVTGLVVLTSTDASDMDAVRVQLNIN
tara:strand:- start:2981 stop:4810 length:1830 start_codon:yes stop_codon:yes gene_type:complete